MIASNWTCFAMIRDFKKHGILLPIAPSPAIMSTVKGPSVCDWAMQSGYWGVWPCEPPSSAEQLAISLLTIARDLLQKFVS